MELKKLRLNRHEDKRLQGGHLWIFSNEVNNRETPLKQFLPGEQVRVEGHNGKFLGMAYVNPHSLICGRIFSFEPQVLDHVLLMHRLKQALSLRTRLFDEPFYRLVYGESDLLPGLVVDRFGAHLSVQLNSAGMEVLKYEIIDVLKILLNPQSILLRNDSSMRQLEGLPRKSREHTAIPQRKSNCWKTALECWLHWSMVKRQAGSLINVQTGPH